MMGHATSPLATEFFGSIRAATAQRATALPVPRDQRLVEIDARIAELTAQLAGMEFRLKLALAGSGDAGRCAHGG